MASNQHSRPRALEEEETRDPLLLVGPNFCSSVVIVLGGGRMTHMPLWLAFRAPPTSSMGEGLLAAAAAAAHYCCDVMPVGSSCRGRT